jgi:hypothetical protein
MIWIISIAILLLAITLFLPGALIHSITYTAAQVAQRKTNETFALSLMPEIAGQWLENFKGITWREGSATIVGSKGTIIIANQTLPIEVTHFVPNYRWAFKTPYSGKIASVQISFYRIGTSETRIVLLIKASSTSIIKRTLMAFGKNSTQQKMENMLSNLSKIINTSDISPVLFEDTTAEQNPNLTL